MIDKTGGLPKTTEFTLDDVLGKIQNLMDTGDGDLGRLRFILMTLRRGKNLYASDKQYLENKIGTEIEIVEKQKIEKSSQLEILSSIQELIKLGIGGNGRLQFIYETIQNGKKLYTSDRNYLNEKLSNVTTNTFVSSEIEKEPLIDKKSLDSIETQLTQANTKIAILESQLAESKSKLKETKHTQIETQRSRRAAWLRPSRGPRCKARDAV